MVVADGRLMSRAPTHAPAGHFGTAVAGDIAVDLGRGTGDVAHLACGHGGQLGALSGEVHLVAVEHHVVTHRVGPHIIGSPWHKASDIEHEASSSFSTDQMGTLEDIGIGNGVPAHTACIHDTLCHHIAATRDSGLRDVDGIYSRHRDIGATARSLKVVYLLRTLVLVGRIDLEAEVVCRVAFQTGDGRSQGVVL